LTVYLCDVCKIFEYDDQRGHSSSGVKPGTEPEEFPSDWECPICKSDSSHLQPKEARGSRKIEGKVVCPHCGKTSDMVIEMEKGEMEGYLGEWRREKDELEVHMADIHKMSVTGESIIEPMRTTADVISWNELLVVGAQLSRIPLNDDENVDTRTVIGPSAKRPLVIDMPIFVTHMSFGALSREVKMAIAKGTAAAGTAMGSGEGGALPDTMSEAYRYILEYVPNRYSITPDVLKRVDAIEIKVGQSSKPGMGGHLPASKVTDEISEIRGFPQGTDIVSPARFEDINDEKTLRKKVSWLREQIDGGPIGIKLAAGAVEEDMTIAVDAGPDYITIDGRPGATAASPKFVKEATSVPTIYALGRARDFLDKNEMDDISLVITGGLRVSPDFAKALSMGADAIAIGTAALMACACQQYRMCDTGKCPVGVTTQDPELRGRLKVDYSAKKLENFLRVSNEELKSFARLTGNDSVHKLSRENLRTYNSEISQYTGIGHV
jgi:glutamate synthase domain-containing protein 2/rubredoxin